MGPRLTILLVFSAVIFLFCLLSCDQEEDAGSDPADSWEDDDNNESDVDHAGDDDNDDTSHDDDNDDSGPECDPAFRPLVFLHGFIENGDAFSTQAMRFASNGYCLDSIYTYDWNTVFSLNWEAEAKKLDDLVDRALAETGADKVDLMGHSMGSGLAYFYLSNEDRAAKVAHYAALAGFFGEQLPGGVALMSISSEADYMTGVYEIPGAQNVIFDDKDHLEVATCEETFAALYPFFNEGQQPATTEVIDQEPIELSGRAVVFGINDPSPGSKIEVYAVDPATGERLTGSPAGTFTSDADGTWGPFTAKSDTHYEFVIDDPDLFWPPVHYYREPFARSNNKVYFRTLPPKASPLGLVFGLLPFNDQYALFAWLGLNRAVVYGRDTLTADGHNLATEEMASAENTTIAIFFFDTNFNGISEEIPAGGLFTSFPFVRFFDILIDADPSRPIPFVFNGRTMAIRNWKSKTEGLSIPVFD